MWNGTFGRIAIAVLPVLVVLGGCDSGASPMREAHKASASSDPRADLQLVDLVRNRIWVLTDYGVTLYSNARRERVVIALPGWSWAGPPYGCAPNLALGPKGEAIITSDITPTLWRIDPETLAVTVHRLELDSDTDKDIGFSELAYSSQHGKYFAVSAKHGSVWSVDPSLGKAQKIEAFARGADSCGSKR